MLQKYSCSVFYTKLYIPFKSMVTWEKRYQYHGFTTTENWQITSSIQTSQ